MDGLVRRNVNELSTMGVLEKNDCIRHSHKVAMHLHSLFTCSHVASH